MNERKRILGVLFALILVLTLPLTAFAEEEGFEEGAAVTAANDVISGFYAWAEGTEPVGHMYPDNGHYPPEGHYFPEAGDNVTLKVVLAPIASTSDISNPTFAWYEGATQLAGTGDTIVIENVRSERLIECNISDGHGNTKTVKFYIHVTAGHIPGDINGDGDTDMIDLLMLAKFVRGIDDGVIEAACDVNGDGEVDMIDVLVLGKYLKDPTIVIY
ncbi:MAG: hypothetical protein IJL78_00590 [Lachnospiraceae bacterium]|nr:hypothetical protein [Lachnospiraceae bacterium]